jgi:hypothetical protein
MIKVDLLIPSRIGLVNDQTFRRTLEFKGSSSQWETRACCCCPVVETGISKNFCAINSGAPEADAVL